MMTCRELAEALVDLLAGELSDDHHKACKDHMDGCSRCALLHETYHCTFVLVRRLPRPSLPDSLMTRLRALLAEQAGGPRQQPSA